MTAPRHIAVLDVGKTNVKIALVDMQDLSEKAVLTRSNTVLPGPPWPHFDTEGHWAFFLEGLAEFHRAHHVDAIAVTTHGACAALLDEAGNLAAPILDYEHDGPDALAAQYDAIRSPFSQTGSPRLTGGLNVGAQLYWQFAQDAGLFERTKHIVMYPQYWTYRLIGVPASDVTSIGCHTDLWNPHTDQFSDLVARLNIAGKMAPVHKSAEVLGVIREEVALATGLPGQTPVVCGIHDSNASLYPYVLTQDPPFSVVSSGTWLITMSMGAKPKQLDPRRDTLINVNAMGQAVPSARFMGGREFEIILQGQSTSANDVDARQVLETRCMLLPAVDPTTGPFQGQQMQWLNGEPPPGTSARTVATAYYLALMTDVCLQLTGGHGPILVEGPFARSPRFLDMLRAATERPVHISHSVTGTSIGAAMLFGAPDHKIELVPVPEPTDQALLARYAAQWKHLTAHHRAQI
ncbi:MAG: FGGY-family carbohydrate kinase [Paracoccaceae bacterium]|nr:FGGY-family carbohydrate kinase [Paracoccaceae bacterium]